jgi:hypothetical protein
MDKHLDLRICVVGNRENLRIEIHPIQLSLEDKVLSYVLVWLPELESHVRKGTTKGDHKRGVIHCVANIVTSM